MIGVSRQAGSKWERAESSPDTDNLISPAKLYDMTLDDMLNPDMIRKGAAGSSEKAADIQESKKNVSLLKTIPCPIVVVIIYLYIGIVWNLWHPGLLLFLTLPMWGAVVSYISKKNNKDE